MKKYVSYDKLLLTCIIVLFSIYLSITLISTSFADYTTTATCSHTALGVQYSEVAHPHKYFRTCDQISRTNLRIQLGKDFCSETGYNGSVDDALMTDEFDQYYNDHRAQLLKEHQSDVKYYS